MQHSTVTVTESVASAGSGVVECPSFPVLACNLKGTFKEHRDPSGLL